jgi:ZIP family zinc transporter
METGWLENTFRSIAGSNPIWQGLIGGLFITLTNAIGALAVLVWRKPSEKFLNAALGFAAGVMLTASFTSLILPGIEFGEDQGGVAVYYRHNPA